MHESSGFTLIELILVTVIIGILAGMVAVNIGHSAEKARIQAARGDISTLVSAIDRYALEHNDTYPDSLNDLVTGKERYLRDLKMDPWGHDYVYQKPGAVHSDSFDVFSAGKDGAPGTEDDVTETVSAHGRKAV